MRYCARCVYPENHALNIILDDAGICSGCKVHEEKDTLDWDERGRALSGIFSDYRNRSGNNYDCIIPVSGARDSYFIVYMVKVVYGMNPLLVTYNKHYNTDTGVRNLANLRIRFNCDIITLTANPNDVKKITRATLRKRGSLYWHCIAGQTVFPVQVAVKFKIPLIVWGAHQGLDQVGMFSHLDEVEMTRKYRKEHDLMGLEAEDLIDDFDEIDDSVIRSFKYPEDRELEQVGVRGIYLNNYIRWDSKTQHEQMIREYDYETREQPRTYDTCNDADCFNYSDVHDYIKYLKHGYSKIYDHCSRDIRLGHLSRDEAIALIKTYKDVPPVNLPKFLEWLGITENSFNYIIDQHRNPDSWKRNENWEWESTTGGVPGTAKHEPPFTVRKWNGFPQKESRKSTDAVNKYILIGRGYE